MRTRNKGNAGQPNIEMKTLPRSASSKNMDKGFFKVIAVEYVPPTIAGTIYLYISHSLIPCEVFNSIEDFLMLLRTYNDPREESWLVNNAS